MRHLHFVVNPAAGRGRAINAWKSLNDELCRQSNHYKDKFYVTQSYVGDTFSWEKEGPVMERVLVCIGGDGSVHYNAQMAMSMGVPLGIVPAGTGNDFATNLGLPRDVKSIVHTLLWGTPTPVDSISVNGQMVANLAGYGIDAEVVEWVAAHDSAKQIRQAAYALAVPIVLARHKRFSVTLRFTEDDAVTIPDVSILALANGKRFGGGMKIAPEADMQDGKLEVIVASGLSKLGLLRLFPKIYSGAHMHDAHVSRYSAAALEIEFSDRIPSAEYDGEPYQAGKKLSVQLFNGLHILMPTTKTGPSAH